MADKTPVVTTLYCPRCDRKYTSKKDESYKKLMDRLIKHVALQHPDHDPQWYDTYPTPV